MLCSLAEVNGQRLRNGTISKDERGKLVEKMADLSRAPLFVDDTPSRTMTEIAAAARRLKRKHRLGPDRDRLLAADRARQSARPAAGTGRPIARRLKGLARELDVPVLCLAQFNRQAEVSRENKPRLSHLRESGAIEQDADVVMFVHREEYFATDEEEKAKVAGQAELIVAKQRNGPTGDHQARLAQGLHAISQRHCPQLRRIRAIQHRRQLLTLLAGRLRLAWLSRPACSHFADEFTLLGRRRFAISMPLLTGQMRTAAFTFLSPPAHGTQAEASAQCCCASQRHPLTSISPIQPVRNRA